MKQAYPEAGRGYLSNFSFFYGPDHKIKVVTNGYHPGPLSQHDMEVSSRRKADSSIAQYYYADERLDSVCTREFIRKAGFERFRRTYYNTNGLPVLTNFDDNSVYPFPRHMEYKYVQR